MKSKLASILAYLWSKKWHKWLHLDSGLFSFWIHKDTAHTNVSLVHILSSIGDDSCLAKEGCCCCHCAGGNKCGGKAATPHWLTSFYSCNPDLAPNLACRVGSAPWLTSFLFFLRSVATPMICVPLPTARLVTMTDPLHTDDIDSD